MRAVAHGWTPSRMKSPPSRAVAQEFVEADRKYSGGFAENRYLRGGLAQMGEPNSGVDETLNWQRGGRTRRNGGGRRGGAGAGTPTTTNVPTVTAPPSRYGTEAGTTQSFFDRLGGGSPMGYIGVVSGLRREGWTPAPGADPNDLRNTMWYPPEQTLTGGGGGGGGPGGPSQPPPRIIPTDPASYVGTTAASSREGSEYRKDLRKHQRRIEKILGSARGGHVNYYQEGGAARPGHAEGPNPFEGKNMPASYSRWERENHIDPPPPPEVAEEVEEEGGVGDWLRGLFTPDPETAIGSGAPRGTIEEQMEEMEQAYGGRVNYQTGGLATAAPGRILPPAGGVPPWIEPIGSGPGYMEPEPEGYQFGGAARGYRGVPPQRGGIRRGRQPRRGMMSRGAGGDPNATADRMRAMAGRQRGMMQPGGGQPPGGLAAMMQQAQAQQAGAARGVGLSPYEEMENRMRGPRGPLAPGGGGGPFRPGGGVIGKPMPGPGTFAPGEGIPGGGNIPPYKQLPGRRIAPPPGKYPGGSGPFNPGPMPDERGPVGGGVVGGPRVPPNMTGFLQKMRMQNRPPSGPVGGGGNRVGMQDQQGALSRALQRGTGRPPMSRRSAFGRAQ